jgi:RNA polymerase-binding transcription factor DksA
MKMIDAPGSAEGRAGTLDVLPGPNGSTSNRLGRWRWHHAALVKLRERLLNHRTELAVAITEPLASWDMADAANDDFEHALALSRLSAEQDILFEIEAALKRIRSGTYGLCEATGKPIPAARLKAIPWTRFIREVEDELEGLGFSRAPHLGELKSVHAGASLAHAGETEDGVTTEEEGL